MTEGHIGERHMPASFVAPLFVPGDRVDRAASALERGAQCLVLDLEDAVAPERKPDARARVASFVGSSPAAAAMSVRVNSQPDELRADLAALAPHLDAIYAVVLAKTDSAAQVVDLRRSMEAARSDSTGSMPSILPIIETAAGLEDAAAIAAAPGVATLLFGPADLSADLGTSMSADGLELLMARSRVVHACALARIARPIDGAHLVLDDDPGLEISARHARQLGFGGKAVIHPRQLPTVRRVFTPNPAQVEWATRVVEAFDRASAMGVGALRLEDGTFIDEPVARRARAILRLAGELCDPTETTR